MSLTRFCKRMGLDYCDEHQLPLGGGKLLNYDEYCNKYSNYLEKKYEDSRKVVQKTAEGG